VFTVPTGLTLGIGPLATQRVRLLRVQPGSVHLGRIHALAELIEQVVGGRLEVDAARARLAEIERRPPVHGPLTRTAAFALASAASAVFFGAQASEVAASGAIGALVGLLALGAERSARLARLFEVLAAAVAAFLAGLASTAPLALEREVVTLAAIIVLLPGYTLTVAMNELAARHYSSGTARLGGVLATLFLLACGAAVGTAAADAALAFLPAGAGRAARAPLPGPALWGALILAPLAFKVLFQARDRDAPWIVGAAWVAFLGARGGAQWLGPWLGAGCGAFVLGLASNGLARVRLRPATITAVPGLLVLVPGSLGFRGATSLLAQDAGSGLELVARMLAIAMALVCGLLLAGVAFPSQRTL
jgi:uncharacterized membrane protein YjjP (DUF1212 family)